MSAEAFDQTSIAIAESIPLIGLTFFRVNEVVERLEAYRDRTRDDPTALKHERGPSHKLPKSAHDWDWFDRQFVEKWFCSRIAQYFKLSAHLDPKDIGDWFLDFKYMMKCELNWQVNSKLRFMFYMPVRDPNFRGIYNETRVGNALTSTREEADSQIPKVSDEDLKKTTFLVIDKAVGEVTTDYGPDLKGMEYYSVLFHNHELNDASAYNGWNFTNHWIWDGDIKNSFWYTSKTRAIYTTTWMTLGEDQAIEASLPA